MSAPETDLVLVQPPKSCSCNNVQLHEGRAAQVVHHEGAGTASRSLKEIVAGGQNGLQHLHGSYINWVASPRSLGLLYELRELHQEYVGLMQLMQSM